jgi:hypothetical protein
MYQVWKVGVKHFFILGSLNNFNQSPRSANDLDLELGRWGRSHVMGRGDMVKVCAKYGRPAMKTV